MNPLGTERKPSGSGLGVFLAKTLKRLRTDRGMSQEALAEKSGLDRTYISLLERNRKNVTLGTLEKIIPHLSTDPVDFFANFSAAISRDLLGTPESARAETADKDLDGVGVTGLYCVKLLGQFADWVASEVREPVVRLRQALAVAVGPANTDVQVEKSIQEIERILTLLSLFSTAASNAGSEIPVKTLLESAAALAPLGGRKIPATIKINSVDDKVTVKGHPAHLIFALLAVLNWLITDDSGAIDLSIEPNEDNTKVKIAIVNSARKLDDSQRSQVFAPTFLKSKSKDRDPRNLGLCLAKGIFEEHLGSLTLDPVSHQTRFLMDLPRS